MNNNTEEQKEAAPAPKAMIISLIILAGLIFVLMLCVKDYFDKLGSFKTRRPAVSGPAPAARKDAKHMAQYNTEVKFRKFYITAPKAKQVELLADFNGWGKVPITLKEYNKSYFDTTVALAAGEYKYIFLIDGKEVLDPTNDDRIEFNGREVCIKTVR